MSKTTNHLDKVLSSVNNKPILPSRTGLPPTLRNAALIDTIGDDMLDLYPGDVAFIRRPVEKAVTHGAVCALVSSPVAGVVGRPVETIV